MKNCYDQYPVIKVKKKFFKKGKKFICSRLLYIHRVTCFHFNTMLILEISETFYCLNKPRSSLMIHPASTMIATSPIQKSGSLRKSSWSWFFLCLGFRPNLPLAFRGCSDLFIPFDDIQDFAISRKLGKLFVKFNQK